MLQVENLSYKYGRKTILQDINLCFESGKMYAIIGSSGSGKTTLLSLLAGLDTLQEGELRYQDKKISKMNVTNFRRNVSVVFQSYNLIYYMTPLQNVITALDIVKVVGRRLDIAKTYLHKVGITEDEMNRSCGKLSGGQQQRVAIARALACNSSIIFADEPTGNLDHKIGKDIIQLLKSLAVAEGKCVICVTHDAKLAGYANEIIDLLNGEVQIK